MRFCLAAGLNFGVTGDGWLLLVRKFAPEAGGSGIPELKVRWSELRPVRCGACCR